MRAVVGDLLLVRKDMTAGGPGPLKGDVVQVVDISRLGYVIVLLRTGQRSAGWNNKSGWIENWFDPLPLTPSNKDNDHEPTSR